MKILKSFSIPKQGPSRQSGFTLVELLVVIAIVGILISLVQPRIRAIIIEGRVESTAKDIISATNVLRASAAANGTTTPYTTLGATAVATASFANAAMAKATNLSVAGVGAAATVAHNLGATNSQITVAQAANPTAGDSFTVTVPTANKAACPGLASQLSRVADVITINAVVVKALNGVYNGTAGENACTADDTNAFVFTFR